MPNFPRKYTLEFRVKETMAGYEVMPYSGFIGIQFAREERKTAVKMPEAFIAELEKVCSAARKTILQQKTRADKARREGKTGRKHLNYGKRAPEED